MISLYFIFNLLLFLKTISGESSWPTPIDADAVVHPQSVIKVKGDNLKMGLANWNAIYPTDSITSIITAFVTHLGVLSCTFLTSFNFDTTDLKWRSHGL